VCEMETPDDDLLKALIIKHADDHQIVIPEDVLRFILMRMERSFTVAQEVVRQLAILSLRDHRPISIPFVKDVLGY
jgi:chromosomal replication initiation ATPase DnaA